MNDFRQLADQMRDCDQKWQQLFAAISGQVPHHMKDSEQTPDLAERVAQVVRGEPNIEQVIENEELIGLYFNRFLLSDRNTADDTDRYYLVAKEKSKQLSEQLFEAMADIASEDSKPNEVIDIQSNSRLLAEAVTKFKTKTLESVAENDIKIYDSKQLVAKLATK